MSKIGPQRAADLTGRSKSTIQRAMNTGKLSYEIDSAGRRVIDVSELERVFGPVVADDEPMDMGQAVKAEMLVPAGVNGHNLNYRSSIGYNPVLANKLLDHFGYKKAADGYRTFPNGKPLTLKINTESS